MFTNLDHPLAATMGKLTELILHPSELSAAIHYKLWRQPLHPRDLSKESAELRRCYELLDVCSRSFAAVIRELHPEVRDAVMLFYLILRALDTIEDDMTLSRDVKIPILRDFTKCMKTPGWKFTDSDPGERDRVVLQEFPVVMTEFNKLKPKYQEVIYDITDRMGNGMADYVIDDDFNNNGVDTIAAYNLYCHHVAGIVGEGLTRITILADFGTDVLHENPRLQESMGLFLQKVNIIRDYREDIDVNRAFWPREIWHKYAEEMRDFKDPKYAKKALHCTSDLVANALEHATDCLDYLDNVTDPSTFTFCAIPQVMAIATLDLVYRNPSVFQKNVKLRKGTTVSLILEASNVSGVCDIFTRYARKVYKKSDPNDPNYFRVSVLCGKIEQHAALIKRQRGPPAKTIAQLEGERKEMALSLIVCLAVIFSMSGLMAYIAYVSGFRWSPREIFDSKMFPLRD